MDIDKPDLDIASVATKATKRSNIIRAMTANDVVFWGADAFISVALALFVVTYINDATVLNVGLALMIHRIVNALTSIPIGRFFDKHKGFLDEVTALSIACFAAGSIYFILSFCTEIWQLYTAMLFLGFSTAVNMSSWRIIFYGHVNQEQMGQTLGVYQMLFSFGIGLFLAIGGFAGDRFGYDKVLMCGGLLMMSGSVLPLMIRSYFVDKHSH